MFRLFGSLVLAAAVSGCVAVPPYGYNDPAYGPAYYALGPSIGVGVGGGGLGVAWGWASSYAKTVLQGKLWPSGRDSSRVEVD